MHATDSLLRRPARNAFRDHPTSSHDLFPLRVSEEPQNTPSTTLRTNGSSFSDRFDKEQRLSSEFKPCTKNPMVSPSMTVASHNPISVPAPVSQPTASLASSPAAMFLSAFSSSPASKTTLPDDEGQDVAGYTLGSVIGYGGFSTIRRAYSTSGGIVAVKIVRRSDVSKQPNAARAKKRLDHETAVWSSLSHEHILPLFSAVHTSYADYFITLYCPAGSLFDILKRDGRPALPHDDAGMMFRQVVRGLRYMHEVAAYVHRDMKLENVLVDEMGVCRIGDFGLSCKIGEIDEEEEEEEEDRVLPMANGGVHRAASMALPATRRLAVQSVARHSSVRHRNSTSSPHPKVFNPGSLPYAAPELLLPRTTPLAPYPSQDIWALGIMLYALLIGRLPFFDSYEPRLQMKIISGVYELPCEIGRGAQRVLKGCMERNVEDRWTIAMVDEVAWDVGWGSGEDNAIEEEAQAEEAFMQSTRSSRSCSQTRSYPATQPFDPTTQPFDLVSPSIEGPLEGPPRSHQEAALRRSTSRLQRSLSRAPVLTDRQPSRSDSRRRRSRAPSPSLGGLNGVILDSGIPDSPYYSPSRESALIVSPTSSPERGRRPNKMNTYFSSRSPSPSMVPSTPVDGSHRYHSLMELADSSTPESISRSRSRDMRTLHFMPEDAPIPETNVLVVDWQAAKGNDGSQHVSSRGRQAISCAELQRERSASRSQHWEDRSSSPNRQMGEEGEAAKRRGEHNRGKRSESTPPTSMYASLPSWAIPENRGRKPLASVVTTGEERFLTPVAVTRTMPTTSSQKILAQVSRSKSVGHGRFDPELYTLRQQLPLSVEAIAR